MGFGGKGSAAAATATARRRLRSLVAIAAAILICAAPAAFGADKVALVIGNAAYRHAPSLLNPGNDARDVGAALTRLDFKVTVLTELDEPALKAALEGFRDEANAAEVAMVYYSGHAIGVDGQSWLAPVDAKLARQDDVEFQTIPLDLVLASVRGARKLRLVVLDACRDNPFIAGMAARPGAARSLSRGLAPVAPPQTDTMVWYAAKDGSTASDGLGRNSPFTEAFLEHVEEPGLELDRLFRQMTAAVQAKTRGRQTPWSYGTRGPDDFFLAGLPAQPERETPPERPLCTEFREQKLYEAAEVDPSAWPAFLEACPESPLAKLRPTPAGAAASAPPPVTPPPAPWAPSGEDFRAAQRELQRLRLYSGQPDGIWGSGSRAALGRFQEQIGDGGPRGELTEALLTSLAAAAAPAGPPTEPSPIDGAPVVRTDDPASLAPGTVFRECDACPEMVVIPGGTYTMGSPESEAGHEIKEGPQRQVVIAAFALGRDVVTVSDFRSFSRATGRPMTGCNSLTGPNWTNWAFIDDASWERPGLPQSDDHPAVCVSWEDAQAYILWLNAQAGQQLYRLPSEAEQEYVLRADHPASVNPWGGGYNEGCNAGNWADQSGKRAFPAWKSGFSGCEDGFSFTAPIDAFPANRFGVRQLPGNVWEWAADCWNENYQGAPHHSKPLKSGDCSKAVVRGGSWFSEPRMTRSAFREWGSQSSRYADFGFRVAQSLPE